MPEASAEDAETSSPAATDAFGAASPAAEIQQSFRSALEKSVAESRAAFAKAKTAADEAASAIEVSFAAAKDGALAINAKGFEALRANADANFDFLKAVFAAKSLSDVVALQAEFARKQVETFTSQSKDLGALTQKAMADAVEPFKAMPFLLCEKCDFILAPDEKLLPLDTNKQLPANKCPKCGGKITGTKETIDNWIDSSITPLVIAGWPDKKDCRKRAYPTSVRIQGTT